MWGFLKICRNLLHRSWRGDSLCLRGGRLLPSLWRAQGLGKEDEREHELTSNKSDQVTKRIQMLALGALQFGWHEDKDRSTDKPEFKMTVFLMVHFCFVFLIRKMSKGRPCSHSKAKLMYSISQI